MRILSAGLVAIALAVMLATSAASATPRRCRTSDLTVDQVRFGTEGSYRDYLDMALVNTGPSKCSLGGWPRVQMLDAHVRPIRTRASRSHPAPASIITLGTWQRTYFTIHFTGGGPCVPKHQVAKGVRVTPPGESGGLIVAKRVDMCTLRQPIPIAIDPLRGHRGRLPTPI